MSENVPENTTLVCCFGAAMPMVTEYAKEKISGPHKSQSSEATTSGVANSSSSSGTLRGASAIRSGKRMPSTSSITSVLSSAGVNSLITLAGDPTTTVLAGTSFVTTAPAPTTAPSPMVTPGNTLTPAPNHTLLPIRIGLAYSTPANLCAGSTGCVAVVKQQLGPTNTLSPIMINVQSRKVKLKLPFLFWSVGADLESLNSPFLKLASGCGDSALVNDAVDPNVLRVLSSVVDSSFGAPFSESKDSSLLTDLDAPKVSELLRSTEGFSPLLPHEEVVDGLCTFDDFSRRAISKRPSSTMSRKPSYSSKGNSKEFFKGEFTRSNNDWYFLRYFLPSSIISASLRPMIP